MRHSAPDLEPDILELNITPNRLKYEGAYSSTVISPKIDSLVTVPYYHP